MNGNFNKLIVFSLNFNAGDVVVTEIYTIKLK